MQLCWNLRTPISNDLHSDILLHKCKTVAKLMENEDALVVFWSILIMCWVYTGIITRPYLSVFIYFSSLSLFLLPFCGCLCQAFVENNPAIRWCPRAGCERAVRLARQGPGASASDPLSFPLLQAPAVDCGKGHLFCWSVLIRTTAS